MSHDVVTENHVDPRAITAAIERFSRKHDKGVFGPNQRKYEELIPKKSPRAGQQYAFEVDLDKCTGCKACVTACHSENGLDEDETWRAVGLVQGGATNGGALQHITTACHHCADPACLNGCPTLAYKKDEETGVVKHLDDQCFGCQYCILKCPYDVPKYNKKRGIVHKCDMCIGRLKDGQGPACVRACPNGAIRITVVDTEDAIKNNRNYVTVADSPPADYTFPTTKYKTQRELPNDMHAADRHNVQPEHSHLPLVFMLVLTQLSVGTFAFEKIFSLFVDGAKIAEVSSALIAAALTVGLTALGASLLHLGRPHLFYRAILGFRKSWLSREIIAFAAFAHLAIPFALVHFMTDLQQVLQRILPIGNIAGGISWLVVATGVTGIYCSVMVYRDTRRPFWDHWLTTLKFFLTAVLLGAVTTLLSINIVNGRNSASFDLGVETAILCGIIIVGSALKLAAESGVFWMRDYSKTDMIQKTALLLQKHLRPYWQLRIVCAVAGGIILPLVIAISGQKMDMTMLRYMTITTFSICLGGELLARYLFFRSVVAYKMPGGC